MNRWTILLVIVLMMALVAMGCSGGGDSPVAPSSNPGITASGSGNIGQAQTHLWGYYDVYIDIENQTVDAVVNRNAMFAANVVTFLNNNPANLGFNILDTPIYPDSIGVEIEVSITHPFSGLPQYNGYDVRGIFLVLELIDGLAYDPNCTFGNYGTSPYCLNDDGWTRFFNPEEFTQPGLFGYTEGVFATPGFTTNHTLNQYKYYADGLGAYDDAFEFITTSTDDGVFTSGSTNTRFYDLDFPMPDPGVVYGYAVVASWIGENPDDHPARAPEACAISCNVIPDIYYVDAGNNGGDLMVNIDIPAMVDTLMLPSTIYLESDVIGGAVEISDMVPDGGGVGYSTYYFETAATNLTSSDESEYWVILEYGAYDYDSGYGAPYPEGAPLAAFFRYSLYISSEPQNQDPVCDLQLIVPAMPYVGWATLVEFDASGSTDPDVGDVLSFTWDFDGDTVFGDTYDAGTDENPQKYYDSNYVGQVCVKVEDGNGGEATCCVDVDITAYPSKNIGLRDGVTFMDLGVDHGDGDLLVLYSDGQVWRYLEADYYQSGALLVSTGHPGINHIDISPNSYFIVGGNNEGTVLFCRSYNPSGGGLVGHITSDAVFAVLGVTSSSFYNYHFAITGGSIPMFDIWIQRFAPPGYPGGSGMNRSNGYGAGNMYDVLIRGMESSTQSSYIYVVEDDPEFRVERYNYTLAYTGVNWGGTESDGMNGFNDPRDITRDDNNDYYILDLLSTGEPVLKKYSSTGTADDMYGDSTTISGDPIKCEGSDYNGNVFVLHEDGLSIFFADELN